MQTDQVRQGRNFLARWGPALLWMGVIFFFSAQPSLPRHPDATFELFSKKSMHALEYGILALLLRRAIATSQNPVISKKTGFYLAFQPATLWAWMTAVVYAASDEFHQSFVPHREARVTDVLIDSLGAALALILIAYVAAWRQNQKRRPHAEASASSPAGPVESGPARLTPPRRPSTPEWDDDREYNNT